MRTSIMKKKPVEVERILWGLILLEVLTQLAGAMVIETNPDSPQSSIPNSNQQPNYIFKNDQSSMVMKPYSSSRLLSTLSFSPNPNNTHLTSQTRLLSTCQIENCHNCIITNSNQFCVVCETSYQPDSQLTQCKIPNTDNTTPITSQCTITNCNVCQSITLGIIRQQICAQCITGYRFFILQGKCYPKSELNDSSEIISYGTYFYLCQQGCKSCQPSTTIQICYTCMSGYAMIQDAYSCIKCKGFCETCKYSDTAFCYTCYLGYVLDSNSLCVQCKTQYCQQCDPYNPNQCYSCISGYFLSNNQCLQCHTSCQNHCDNATKQCSTCQAGKYQYYSSSNTDSSSSINCLSCIYGCMNCSNITQCNQCYPGYFLNSSKQCEACKANCWNCTSSSDCQECLIGYNLFNNKCIKPKDNCILMNQDGTCKFCKSNFSDINGSCVINENDTSIVTMACKYGMFAQSYWCYYCNNTFRNCYQCNSGLCLKCFDGYYLQTNTYQCMQCSITGCQVCQSSKICSQCKDGYYLSPYSSQNANTSSNGKCLSCDSNCKACSYSSNYCTTCYSGYTLSQQRVCETQNKFYITMTLDFNYLTQMNIVEEIKNSLLEMTNNTDSKSKQGSIKILSIQSGSTIINGEVYEENGDELKANSQILMEKLTNGSTIAGVTLLSVTFSEQLPSTPIEDPPTNPLPIILGAVLGGVGLMIIVIIICCCYCRYKNKESQDKESKKPSTEGETVDENDQQNQTPQSFIHNKQLKEKELKSEQDNKSEEKMIDSNVRLGDMRHQERANPKHFNPYKQYL